MTLTPTAEYVFFEQSSTATSIEFTNCHSADRMLRREGEDSRYYIISIFDKMISDKSR